MTPAHRLVFGGTVVEVWPDCVATHLPGGAEVVAAPQDNDSYRATAQRLGYGPDTFRMMRDHEILHTAIAHLLGLPESPTLRGVAEGKGSTPLTDLEEDVVCSLAKLASMVGIDLMVALSRFQEPA
jgi:hypothetical protein